MSSSSRINFGQASPTYRAGYMIDGDSDSDDEKVDLTDVPEDLLDMNEEDFENELRKRFESEMHDLQEGYKAEPIPVEAFRDIPEYVNKKYKSDGGGKPDSKDVDDERGIAGELDSDEEEMLPKVVEVTEATMGVDGDMRDKGSTASKSARETIAQTSVNEDTKATQDGLRRPQKGDNSIGKLGDGDRKDDAMELDSSSNKRVRFNEDMGESTCSSDEGGAGVESSKYSAGPSEKDESKKKNDVVSDEMLFYDPDEDENNQSWVDRHRAREPLDTRQADLPGVPKVVEINPQSSQQQQQPQRTRPLFDTDGVLSCPCCMTTLCMDCQRHEKYKQQYRAMFVMNVKVMPEKLQHDPTDPTVYYPVRCEYCSTEVGVVDPDQVYHFFNVIASDPQ